MIGLNNKKYNISDGSTKIIINTKGDLNTIKNNDLKSFIELLEDGFKPFTESELSNMMIKEMKRLKEDKEWGEKYMELIDSYAKEYAKELAVKRATDECKKDVIIEMLKDGLGDDTILKYVKITLDQLNEIKTGLVR